MQYKLQLNYSHAEAIRYKETLWFKNSYSFKSFIQLSSIYWVEEILIDWKAESLLHLY